MAKKRKPKMTTSTADCAMPFGQYKGHTLRDCPTDHLDWLIGQDWLHEPLKTRIEDHLKTRADWRNMRHEGD